jgi:hypothetical protein
MARKPDLSRVSFYVSCLVLAFGYGVGVGAYQLFPYALLKFGLDSVRSVFEEAPTLSGVRPEEFLQPARHDGRGVTVLEPDRMAPGLTMVSGFFDDGNEVRLIAEDGTPVRRWPVRFSEIFPDPTHLAGTGRIPSTDWNTDIHGALAHPDGSIVFNFEYLGMVKLDRCGAVQWTVPRMTHHSISPSSGGGYWVPGRIFTETLEGYPPAGQPYMDDQILEIAPDGTVLTEVSVSELFRRNELFSLLVTGSWETFPRDGGETAHLNDIEELPDSLADRFPTFSPSDLILSFRHRNLLMVVDSRTWEVQWHRTGPWIRQHDPDFTPRGTISVFNNNSDDTFLGTLLGGSNILELDPVSGIVTTSYAPRSGQEMHTSLRGKHQILPNGNLLVTQFEAGRLFEVDGNGEVVWEYVNRYDEDEVAELTGAIRYPLDYFRVDDWSCEG